MNGMGTLALVSNSSKAVSQLKNSFSQSDQPKNSGTSSFLEIFGKVSSNANAENSPLTNNEEGQLTMLPDFDIDDLTSNEQVRELLDLLPFESQQELMDALQDQNLDQVSQWPEVQQIVLVLIKALGSQLQENENQKHSFQELVERVFGVKIPFSDSPEETVQHLKQYMETKKEDGKSVVDLLIKKENEKTPLPVKPPMFNEPIQLKGLNISQSGHEFGQALSKVEQAVIHIGDKLPKELQQQQFLRQFQSLIQRGVFSQNSEGVNTLSIKLFPAHLGRLDIQITQIEGVITARILTSSTQSRELIETQIAQLRNALNQQQLQVERIEVAHQLERENDDDQSSERNKRDEDGVKDETDNETTSDFEELLKEISINEQI